MAPRRMFAASLVLLLASVGCAPIGPNVSPPGETPSPTSAPPTPSADPAPTNGVTPVRMRILFAEPVLQAPVSGEVAVAGGAIWIERYVDGAGYMLVRFDIVSGRVSTSRQLEYPVLLVSADDGALWVVGPYGGAPSPKSYHLSRVDLETNLLIPVAEIARDGVAVGLGSIWAAAGDTLVELDPETGRALERWDIAADDVDVACGAVWAWNEAGLIRLDPVTGDRQAFDGEGPIYAQSGRCWRWVDDGIERGIERVWPRPATPTVIRASSSIHFDGSTFWLRPKGSMQRWDPLTGSAVGPRWTLDPRDINPHWKVGDDGLVISAGGSVWLVNGWEVVGFDIAAD